MSRQLLNFRLGGLNLGTSVIRSLAPGASVSLSSKNRKQWNTLTQQRQNNDASKFLVSGLGSRSFSSYKGPVVADYSVPKSVASPTKNRHDDPISQRVSMARSSDEILAIFEVDADQMDTVVLSVAVDALFDALKNEPNLPLKAKHQLLTSVGMQKLCKQVRRRSPHMDPGDIINGLKLLSYLAAPGSHQTLQILLKLLTKHANLMDLQQLMYTQFLLDKLDPESKSPLSNALEFALPVVFESKLQTELDPYDPRHICDCLHYASRCGLSEKSINFLVDAALRITDRLSVVDAKSILWSLCDTKVENPNHEPLVMWAFGKLSDAMNELRPNELGTTVDKAARKYGRKTPYFYNEGFVNAFCLRMAQPSVDPMNTLWSVKSVSKFRHLNIEYVDRLGEIIASNPSHILNNDKLFEIFVKAICGFNYKPEKWNTFSSILLEHPVLTKKLGFHEVSLTYDFLALELFPDSMIRTLFSADGLALLEEFQMKNHPIYLVLLYNAVKVLHPEYRGPLPPISMIENWKELARAANRNKQYPLKAALQTGLGGESYVINGLYHDGLHIDHGIVMRKGGYPVAVNSQVDSQSDCLSSIAKPAESVIVLIKVFTGELYANNTRRLRGLAALELKILENLGHPVVPVDLALWMELPDHEKIPYLMQKIRGKMEPMQWNQNWGDVIPP